MGHKARDADWSSAGTIHSQVIGGERSASAVAARALDRIAHENGKLNAFLHLDGEGAFADASGCDAALGAGLKGGSDAPPPGLLAGVPIAIKDNICTRGVPTTCASRILQGWRPPYDATVVTKLRAAGAVIVGKTNMDELAMGSSTETGAFGPTHNPRQLGRSAGGSSGGSAAAVAAGLVPVALGSDTGGSVRQPGAFCGSVALKPSYGRVSRYGLVAFASSLDQIGPIARNVRDAARVLQVIAGPDPRDATCAARPVEDYLAACDAPLSALRVGVLDAAGREGCDPAVSAAFEGATAALAQLGATPTELALPHAEHAVSIYYLIAPAEASSNLARLDGMRFGLRVADPAGIAATYEATRAQGFGPEVKRRILLGTYALSAGYYDAYYLRAQKARTLLRQDFADAFAACDIMVTPTAPTPAFRLGEKLDDPLAMYLSDVFTLPASLAGLPAINLPCGLSPEGLPIGVQLIAAPFQEAKLLQVAAALEAALAFDPTIPEPPVH